MLRADHVLAGREDLVKLTGLTEEGAQHGCLHAPGLPSVVLFEGALFEGALDRFKQIVEHELDKGTREQCHA